MKKIRWGILSTAKIGIEKVIPALQKGQCCEVTAIASRNEDQAKEIAAKLQISKAYGSYEALLNDAEIDAVYIPLPNHLHVEWAIKAMSAGKHVLCEKPIGLSSAEGETLLAAAKQNPQLKVMEAFMYRFHPQWAMAKKLATDGSMGELKTIQSFFSYFNNDPNNIRNQKDIGGGGGLMDIGCYNISLSRFLFDKEPLRVMGLADFDPVLKIDRLCSGIMEFAGGTSTFTCSTQLTPFQRVHIFGTTGYIEMVWPFSPQPDKQASIWLHNKTGSQEIFFEATDQYTLQGDYFAKAILDDTPVPTPLEDAVNNMKVIEAIFKSAENNSWQKLKGMDLKP
jgi:predicted dehydrogenase